MSDQQTENPAAPPSTESPGSVTETAQTRYDFGAAERSRHRMLVWALPATLALAAIGSYFGYDGLPKAAYPATRTAFDLEVGAMAIAGILAVVGVIICAVAAWPARVFGPTAAPSPKPKWLRLLIAAGSWLATIPFSVFSLIFVGVGADAAVSGAWVKAILGVMIGLAFGAGAALLVAGSGAAAAEGIRPGEEVPESVRKSAWWDRAMLLLVVWAVVVTVAVIVFGILGQWDNFWDAIGTAIASWVGYAKAAASGEISKDALRAEAEPR